MGRFTAGVPGSFCCWMTLTAAIRSPSGAVGLRVWTTEILSGLLAVAGHAVVAPGSVIGAVLDFGGRASGLAAALIGGQGNVGTAAVATTRLSGHPLVVAVMLMTVEVATATVMLAVATDPAIVSVVGAAFLGAAEVPVAVVAGCFVGTALSVAAGDTVPCGG